MFMAAPQLPFVGQANKQGRARDTMCSKGVGFGGNVFWVLRCTGKYVLGIFQNGVSWNVFAAIEADLMETFWFPTHHCCYPNRREGGEEAEGVRLAHVPGQTAIAL